MKLAYSSLFLVGPMGVGKTAIGMRLARRLSKRFIDSDLEIEISTGADIASIFEIEGVAGFRRREHKILAQLVLQQDVVLATGGGAVINDENRQALSDKGFVVYLKADLDQLVLRNLSDSSNKRPLLRAGDPAQVLEETLAEREILYNSIADLTIDTSDKSVDGSVNQIYDHYISL